MAVEVTTFQQKLAEGRIGESLIARYLRSKGWAVLPVYEKEIDNGKGPCLFLPYGLPENELIAPDLLLMREKQVRWVEAKSKTTATWSLRKKCYQTGIDLRLYKDYQKVQSTTKWPVWLVFLQKSTLASNAPEDAPPCPTGLYGCPITQPIANDSYGRFPHIVYWNIKDLKKLATLADVLAA